MADGLSLVEPSGSRTPLPFAGRPFPNQVATAGPDAAPRFSEFFTANIRKLFDLGRNVAEAPECVGAQGRFSGPPDNNFLHGNVPRENPFHGNTKRP